MVKLQHNVGTGGAMWMELGTRGGALTGEDNPTAVKWPGFTGVANDGNGLDYGQGGTVDAGADSQILNGRLFVLDGVLLTQAPAVAGTLTIFRHDGVTTVLPLDFAAGQAPEYVPIGMEVNNSIGFSAQISQSDMEVLLFFRDITGSNAQ